MRKLLLQNLLQSPLTIPPPPPSEAALTELAAKINRATQRRLGRSLSIRQVVKYDCALSHEYRARALSISKGVVAKYVKAAEASGVGWAELAAADEARLRVLLGGTPRPRGAAVEVLGS